MIRRRVHDVRGKSVFITGPARGIGAQTARLLARKGARLSLVGIEPERLKNLAQELGDCAAWFEADVTDTDQVNRATEAAVERFGGIDVVLANAGIAPIGSVGSIEPDVFEQTVDVNLLGVWRTVRATLDHIIESRGYILTVASMAAPINTPFLAHYAAGKRGVQAFSNSLRTEVATYGVDVGVAYFNFIDTDLQRGAYLHPKTRALRDRFKSPLTKMLSAEHAARAVVRGIELRSREVFVPRWTAAVVWLPELSQRISDWSIARKAGDILSNDGRSGGEQSTR